MNEWTLLILCSLMALVVLLLCITLFLSQRNSQKVLMNQLFLTTTQNQTMLNLLMSQDARAFQTLQQATGNPLSNSESNSEPEFEPNEDSSAFEEAENFEAELSKRGLQLGDLDYDLNAAGYDPVIFRIDQSTGQPDPDSFTGTGFNA